MDLPRKQRGVLVISVVLSLTLKPLPCLLTVFTLLEKGTQSNLIPKTKGKRATVFNKGKKESYRLVLQVIGVGAVKEISHTCGAKEAQDTQDKGVADLLNDARSYLYALWLHLLFALSKAGGG